MAFICPRCQIVHKPSVSCEESAKQGEKLREEVRHHQRHCDDRCAESFETAYWHVLRLKEKKEARPKIIGSGV